MERIEGINDVLAALEGGRKVYRIYLAEGRTGKAVDKIIEAAGEKRIPVKRVSREKVEGMSLSGHAQGVIAEVEAFRYADLEDIFARAESRGEEPFIVILDGIEDPQNLGSIIRTAECAGVHGVIIPKHRAAGVTPAVARASAGAVEHMAVVQATNLVSVIKELKERGLWVIGADMDGREILGKAKLPTPAAVVVGGESQGVRRLVKENCDVTVRIPMFGVTGSLNAGVAAALVIYEVVKGRAGSGQGQTDSSYC